MAQPTDTEWPSEPRTLLKHQIYKRYVDCWMGKILQTFPSASIVDAFAGPGGYSDGPDGSSLVIVKAFLNHTGRERFRTLRLICNEARADRNEALARRLAALPTDARLEAFVIEPASTFEAAISIIERRAHPRGEPLPTLWLLDPFDVKSVPFDLVARCLGGARDEILLTFFADEIYRFCEVPSFQVALTAHYGGDHWRQALAVTGEHQRKAAFMRLYRDGLETLPGVKTGDFSITSKNETARYSIVLATTVTAASCAGTRSSGGSIHQLDAPRPSVGSLHWRCSMSGAACVLLSPPAQGRQHPFPSSEPRLSGSASSTASFG